MIIKFAGLPTLARSNKDSPSFEHLHVLRGTGCLVSLQGLIAGVLLGLNTTVFAYGATGSGKTYTMVGTPTDPGIMVLSMSDIFAFMVRSGPCTL